MIQKILLSSPHYPRLLKQIHNPPPIIYGKGTCEFSDTEHYLCIVGARDCSQYASEVLSYILPPLSQFPITIISGLARGVDTIAHTQALSYNMRCIGVPGSSLQYDTIYPRSSRELAHRLEYECNSCIISPFESTQHNKPWVFPVRNRIMAGLSHAVLVIEAKKSSGTLITASHALNSNREVLCIPGPITSLLSEGTNDLIAKGATLIQYVEDILRIFKLDTQSNTTPTLFQKNDIQQQLTDNLDKMIISTLTHPQSHDTLLNTLSLSPAVLVTHLANLEIKGYITISNGVITRVIP